jgi:hypothetical protein
MIIITFDIDWAPDIVIEDTLRLLDESGARATIFATHATSLLTRIQGHEIGIHPNFLNSNDYSSELDRLMSIYPRAKGVRCHSYYENFPLLDLFKDYGIIYDSNLLMFRCQGIRAFRYWNGLIRLPIFWADGVNCCMKGNWDMMNLPVTAPDSLYIFGFHPIHVFLNTEKLERYDAAKPHYNDVNKLRQFVNPESSGVGTRVFLKRLLGLISGKEPSATLEEIVAARYINQDCGNLDT